MTKPNTSKSGKIFIISGLLLMIGIGLVALPLAIIALTLPMPSVNANSVETWVKENLFYLQMADELIAFGAPIILVATLLLYNQVKKQYPISSSLSMIIAIILTISVIAGIVLPLGRLVYPINGLPVVTGKIAIMTASQVFAGIHLLMLSLAIYVIAFSLIARSRLVIIFSFIVAFLQIIGTYYAEEIFVPLHLIAIAGLLIWAIVFGIYLIKKAKAIYIQ